MLLDLARPEWIVSAQPGPHTLEIPPKLAGQLRRIYDEGRERGVRWEYTLSFNGWLIEKFNGIAVGADVDQTELSTWKEG